jgi:para-nitrobenzyl esterase
MPTSSLSRRRFLWRTSVVALSGSAPIEHTRGQDLKFVIAETSSGKIRGIENRGIRIFKGILYGASTEGANRFMAPADPADPAQLDRCSRRIGVWP